MTPARTHGPVLWNVDERGVANLVFNRPEVRNAYNGAFIAGLLGAMDAFETVRGLRAILITGNGRHFQAGADLKWVDEVRGSTPDENIRVSRATAEAVHRLNVVRVPTVALVQGGCLGGGTGIIAACDVVIAAEDAFFSIGEVRWGLTAAIIIPQLKDAIGIRQVRRYALSGERFDAEQARLIGLVHDVVPLTELDAAGSRVIGHVLENAPDAIAQTKALALQAGFGNLGGEPFDDLVQSHASKRHSLEAAEGLRSFVEKRTARWEKLASPTAAAPIARR
jgi:methylglutaconyl-CoA hydratase